MFVIPAYAGIQKTNNWNVETPVPRLQDWIPAFAGMTGKAATNTTENPVITIIYHGVPWERITAVYYELVRNQGLPSAIARKTAN
ncbi:MAG: hypothetical protein ACOYXY_17300 [Thermodesulfobacteriota bacterium]